MDKQLITGEQTTPIELCDILTAAGWRVLIITSRTSLADAWRELHSPATGGFRPRGPGTEAPVPASARLDAPAAAAEETA